MIEPAHKVVFHVASPPPVGQELEIDAIPIRQQTFIHPLQQRVKGATKSKDTNWKPERCLGVANNSSVIITSHHQGQHGGNQGNASLMSLIPFEVSWTDMQTCRAASPSSHRTTDAVQFTCSSGLRDSRTFVDPPKPLQRSQETPGTFQRHEKAIQSREDTVSWYFSRSMEPIDIPLSSANNYNNTLTDGDLFIHCHQSGIQVWLWEGLWTPIKEGHPHPRIEGYCLSILHGSEPSWVTRKTRTTYASKKRRN
ncbi:hypothetical protein M404DRAFT_9133 [Pisolithus tinctorius Marx 270]|uniref:Uncharacterized protein n=1 Tax=Pisolithus tinctorius Marx 270 TaxID=870435 RepID=A0A0C3PBP8_PISTI|nr:hypothetical protein M404DRAFT_9133 [Pisolithus tinctorius Marx 270]